MRSACRVLLASLLLVECLGFHALLTVDASLTLIRSGRYSSDRPAHGSRWGPVICSEVVSPFEASGQPDILQGPLPLTLENVEAVLDEMRPYLIDDGGNVAVRDIDGGTVVLELQGACGTCPSSSMTMKMGLEKGLLEKIPEIIAV